ncbi:MAG: GGDEF domain-containing protein [Oscillospiraceae bacterium]|nr:GGDEF domain-containing protein [Oscillospiraceae bacterium]
MAVLIVREEIICILVLVFLICYKAFYREKGSDNTFLKVASFGLGHVIFDLITVIAVNNLDIVPYMVNKILHILFYYFGMLFIMEFYNYVVKLTMPHNMMKRLRRIGYIPLAIFTVLSFILPIEYVQGNGTNYSYGPLLISGYCLFAVYSIVCLVLTILKIGRLDLKVRLAVLPTTILMFIVIAIQAVIPELLMTGAGVTIVCIGLFVTVNDPVNAYMEQAYWDSATGIKNKNGFKKQLEYIAKKYAEKKVAIGFIISDMNGLKVINDNYGHAEGDKLIKAAATVLFENLHSAYGVYRIGGDEFAAIYISPDDETVKKEMECVRTACENYKDSPIKLSIAMGYASGGYSSDYMDIYNKADGIMYEDKQQIKKQHPELCGR